VPQTVHRGQSVTTSCTYERTFLCQSARWSQYIFATYGAVLPTWLSLATVRWRTVSVLLPCDWLHINWQYYGHVKRPSFLSRLGITNSQIAPPLASHFMLQTLSVSPPYSGLHYRLENKRGLGNSWLDSKWILKMEVRIGKGEMWHNSNAYEKNGYKSIFLSYEIVGLLNYHQHNCLLAFLPDQMTGRYK